MRMFLEAVRSTGIQQDRNQSDYTPHHLIRPPFGAASLFSFNDTPTSSQKSSFGAASFLVDSGRISS